MPDRLQSALRVLFAGLALAFAATGLLFFLFPDGTVRALNAAGSPLGFPPAPPSALRFWLSLGLAYMVLVTLLAAQIARDPRGRAHLMPLLAAGKATSSLTCAGYFVFSLPAFLYLANALVDGALALVALGAWATSRLGPRRQLLASLKLLALMHFYERPEVWPAVGYDDAYLRRKLLAGPNAAHHAARLAT